MLLELTRLWSHHWPFRRFLRAGVCAFQLQGVSAHPGSPWTFLDLRGSKGLSKVHRSAADIKWTGSFCILYARAPIRLSNSLQLPLSQHCAINIHFSPDVIWSSSCWVRKPRRIRAGLQQGPGMTGAGELSGWLKPRKPILGSFHKGSCFTTRFVLTYHNLGGQGHLRSTVSTQAKFLHGSFSHHFKLSLLSPFLPICLCFNAQMSCLSLALSCMRARDSRWMHWQGSSYPFPPPHKGDVEFLGAPQQCFALLCRPQEYLRTLRSCSPRSCPSWQPCRMLFSWSGLSPCNPGL